VSVHAARRERSASEIAAAFARGDRRALARALTWIEDHDARGREILAQAFPLTGRARLIGITGSPGAGKSTLVDRLALHLAQAGRKVAVVAVDPSSAFSGGAILGDRIRMEDASRNPGVYVRSMATRGHLGGLSRATEDACDLLDAFGFDDVLIETVGVGQDEIEVVQVAHLCVVVLVPFMGDDIQAIKAGIMEIADAYVINKADRDGADRMETHLRAMLGLYDDGDRDIPILRTVATRGQGVPELAACIADLWTRKGQDAGARRARAERRVEGLLRDRLWDAWSARDGARDAIRAAVDAVLARDADPHAAADRLTATISVDHLGIAVRSADEALAFWRDALGLEVAHRERVASEGVTVSMLPAGEARIELLEPDPGDGPVQQFLARRGPGIHHVCLAVTDIRATLDRLRAAGAKIVGEAPRAGAGGKLVAFVHPSSTGGVLLELSQERGA
jgi:LAO/AO transport system kinase